ncbi:MAG: hypothetical protein CTY16_16355 [Methylobacter sp.]|nr:MAG: hypothetical protein CTY16_16355 [Methylobacter sp.]
MLILDKPMLDGNYRYFGGKYGMYPSPVIWQVTDRPFGRKFWGWPPCNGGGGGMAAQAEKVKCLLSPG